MSTVLKNMGCAGPMGRVAMIATALAWCLAHAPLAHADTLLLATTDLVTGTAAQTFSFTAPSSGTVTAEISSIPWPAPLGSLSFSASDASNVLSSWSGTSSTMAAPETASFQVGSGTYFAHVSASAAGSLDLGLYSLMLSFKPAAVPLPASDWTLLIGALALFGLARVVSTFTPLENFKPVELR